MTWLYALRRGAWGASGFAAAAFCITFLDGKAFYAGTRSGGLTVLAGGQYSILLPDPLNTSNAGGFVEWVGFGTLAIVAGVWSLVAVAGSSRDEETGAVEALLAAGVGRADLVLWRFLAFGAWATLFAAAAGTGFAAAVASEHGSVDIAALAGSSASLLALALACFGLVTLAGQVTGPRLATAVSAVALLALFLVNSLGRAADGLRPWRAVSPFNYFEASRPLAGAAFDIRAVEVLVGASLACVVIAALAFAYRDVGEPLWHAPLAVRALLGARYARAIGWVAGLSIVAAVFAEVARHLAAPIVFGPDPRFEILLRRDLFATLFGSMWFVTALLVLLGYVITRVATWSLEDEDGRLELTLAAATPRTWVVIRRGVDVALALALFAFAGALTATLLSSAHGLSIGSRSLFAGSLMLALIGVVLAAFGSVLVASVPRAAAGLIAALTLAAYVLTQIGPLLTLPPWAQDLSPFRIFVNPQPLVDPTAVAVALGVAVAGFAASALLMKRRDVGA